MVQNILKDNKKNIIITVVLVTVFLITFALLANTGLQLYDTKLVNEVLKEQKDNLDERLKISEKREWEARHQADSIVSYYVKELNKLKRSNKKQIEDIETSYDKKISSYDTIAFDSAYQLLADIRYNNN